MRSQTASTHVNETAETVENVEKQPFTEPKLTFVAPSLARHGDATKLTRTTLGFFGTFSPGLSGPVGPIS